MLRQLTYTGAKVAWKLELCRCLSQTRWYAGGAQPAAEEGGGWVSWLKNKLPTSLSGDKELRAMESLTIDSFASTLRTTRRVGVLRGYVSGTSNIQDPAAQGTLRLYEEIIEAMNAEEKADLSLFNAAARQEVAFKCCCTVPQVDDCIAKYEWTRQMLREMATLRRQGKPLPKTVAEVEQSGQITSWREKRHADEQSAFSGTGVVPRSQVDSKGRPCPLRGMTVGRSTKCALSKKSWKSCCGKGISKTPS